MSDEGLRRSVVVASRESVAFIGCVKKNARNHPTTDVSRDATEQHNRNRIK